MIPTEEHRYFTVANQDGGVEFQGFFETEYQRMLHTMLLACGNRDEAEELVQEAMARAFERWDRVSRAQSPAAYVYQIAFNLLRKRRRRATFVRLTTDTGRVVDDPATRIAQRDEIRVALMRLPPTQRNAIILVDWLGLRSEEAAAILRTRPSSVRASLHRGRSQFRSHIGAQS